MEREGVALIFIYPFPWWSVMYFLLLFVFWRGGGGGREITICGVAVPSVGLLYHLWRFCTFCEVAVIIIIIMEICKAPTLRL